MQQQQKSTDPPHERLSIHWTAICRILLLIALCLPARGAQAQTLIPPRTGASLLHLAATQPESMVRVIVQKENKAAALEALVTQIGGRVVRSLALIDGLVVELPAKAIPTLARANGVHYVSLDAPMQLTSRPVSADGLHTLLPLIMQAEGSTPNTEQVVNAATALMVVRDEFSAAAFNNNNGTVQWAGAWIENDPEAGGSGSTVGQVQIVNGTLRLDDSPDTYGQPSAARQINLTGATAATLRFDYRTTFGVDFDDAVAVEVSNNGGATYTVLETFTNIVGEVLGSRSYSIANFIAGNTMIRFRVSNLYGGADEFFSVDNVQVEYSTTTSNVQSVTVRDEFGLAAFNNNDGAQNWAAPWVENDTAIGGAGPAAGQIQIVNGQLGLDDTPDTGGQPSMARQVNLAGATSASLSFDYRTTIGVDPDDAVTVEVSNNGGASYTTLQTFTGITGISYGTRTFDIASFIAANTMIRFRVATLYGASEEFFYVDNVQITYTTTGSTPSGPSNVGRYFRLVAKSEVHGNPWTAVAELNALDANGNVIPKSGWSVVSVDSQETIGEDGRGVNAIDGNPTTYWHTQWFGANPTPPHQIVIDMGATYTLSGFRYLTMQDNTDHGNIANYSFYLSRDGVNWGAALSAGTLLNTPTEQTIIFGKAPVANPVFTTWATAPGNVIALDMNDGQNMVDATGFGADGLYGYHFGNGKGAFTGFEADLLPGYAIDKVQVVLPAYINKLFSKDLKVKTYVAGTKRGEVKVKTDIFSTVVGAANAGLVYVDITTTNAWQWANFQNDLQIVLETGGMGGDHAIYYDAVGLRVITKVGVDNTLTTAAATTGVREAIATSNMLNVFPFAVRAPALWNEAPDYVQGQDMTIAVVDSGIAKTEDLKGRNVINVNFNDGYKDGKDKYGHGTFVATMIASDGKNSGGAYLGIAPRSQVLNVRVSDDQGMSYESDVVEALRWIGENKTKYNIRVVNLSLNSSVPMSYHQSPLNAAVEILWFNGIVVVVAAGNNGTAELFPPANDPFVITVGATDDRGTQSIADDVVGAFSAYGTTIDGHAKPDLVAPGRNIVMSLPHNNKLVMGQEYPSNQIDNNYFRMSGTSMAAPIVAGAVALLLQDEPLLTPDQVKFRLMATARKDWGGYDPVRAGAGYLDVYAAVKGTTTTSANTGITASQLLWTGANPITWGSVSWNSVSWNSVSWNSVSWNSVSWNSVSWNSTYWGDDVNAAAFIALDSPAVNSSEDVVADVAEEDSTEEATETAQGNRVFLPITSR